MIRPAFVLAAVVLAAVTSSLLGPAVAVVDGVQRTIVLRAQVDGDVVTLAGRVSKTPRGAVIVAERTTASGIVRIGRTRARARGRFTLRVVLPVGDHRLSVRSPKTRANGRTLAAARSRNVAVTVAAPVDPVDPIAFDNTANDGSPLGSNLSAIEDFRTDWPFTDLMKQARPWVFDDPSTPPYGDPSTATTDARGNVTSLPAGQIARSILFTGEQDPRWRGRTLVVTYDGTGFLDYGGATLDVAASDPDGGRDVIRLANEGEIAFEVKIDPRQSLLGVDMSDPIRDVRITPTGGICTSDPLTEVEGASACAPGDFLSFERAARTGVTVFDPLFLHNVAEFSSLRFLDWQQVNNSVAQLRAGIDRTGIDATLSATDLARPADQFWSTPAGVPIPVIIELANLMDIDPWIHVPHEADDGWIAAVGAELAAGLAAERRLYLEYSNETWNGVFGQADYVRTRGAALGLDGPGNASFTAGLRFAVRRASEAFTIVEEVYGAAAADRLVRVLSGQAANPDVSRQQLEFLATLPAVGADPGVDAIAIAPYFGDTVVGNGVVDDILAAGATDAERVDAVFDWLRSPGLTADRRASNTLVSDYGTLAVIRDRVERTQRIADEFGVRVLAYEGGQHLLAATPDQRLHRVFDKVNRDPRIAGVYTDYLSDWRAVTGEPLWHYLATDPWGTSGYWGSREFPTQSLADAPKARALQQFIAATR